jgi:hypothetical protein
VGRRGVDHGVLTVAAAVVVWRQWSAPFGSRFVSTRVPESASTARGSLSNQGPVVVAGTGRAALRACVVRASTIAGVLVPSGRDGRVLIFNEEMKKFLQLNRTVKGMVHAKPSEYPSKYFSASQKTHFVVMDAHSGKVYRNTSGGSPAKDAPVRRPLWCCIDREEKRRARAARVR